MIDPRNAAMAIGARIRDDARPHCVYLIDLLGRMVDEGGGLEHVAMLSATANDYCDSVEIAPFGRMIIRANALAWIENQQEHNTQVIELVVSRLVNNVVSSNTLSALELAGDSGKRKVVARYVRQLKDWRRRWDKDMRNPKKRTQALEENMPTPPPSAAVIRRLEDSLRSLNLS